ncbi:hypothetical protein CVT24_001685 [Panaeolus cyanescens]|uniref:F-box domain-containing protein n=1 Tax=Panaeolus cyanescens TaxID=181874 RepID=A0A409YFP8_9AGAR|nr:hypothetical protein CVT24_001685 [Panaeolus cyanescens]
MNSPPEVPNDEATLEYLSTELKDKIISFIDSPVDLLQLALCSRLWCSLIIPDHINYRIIHTRLDNPSLWKELSERKALANNVRVMRIAEESGVVDTLHSSAMVQRPAISSEVDDIIVDVIRSLSLVKTFMWYHPSDARGYDNSSNVIEALKYCYSLEHLALASVPTSLDLSSSIWEIKNLTRLSLDGAVWIRLPEELESKFVSMLNGLKALQQLCISCRAPRRVFAELDFPSLERIVISEVLRYASPGGHQMETDRAIVDFLQRHATITDLVWYPMDQRLEPPRGILPNLRKIESTHHIVTRLLDDPTLTGAQARKMQTIGQISLGHRTMQLLGRIINKEALREIWTWRFERLENLHRIAVLFPELETLALEGFGISSGNMDDYTLDDYIECLSKFRKLRTIKSSTFWSVVHAGVDRNPQEAVNHLLRQCPALERIRVLTRHTFTRDVVFTRGPEGVANWKFSVTPRDWYD